ncbi:SAM-dependent methyltransferase [Microbacterium endophyticum]|uniref:SAM-dependent methyltransferase n=1 Tax=Microbacterium endophyticum TaxID=1526412 RepID=A0A7W4V4M3_9MICO|nr:class I SAM-dependent methyltransferase [Microbacterium endophyticum]MBB2976787.1 SAM-dependent methyltransferase [Microbacterium endophyticum]NIK36576.1 SAM-dependent methyltransferase [Microbacterium endophyticum]
MNGDDIDIEWADAREANLRNWNDRVAIHEEAYELSEFDNPRYVSRVVQDDLPVLSRFLPAQSLHGLELCHLQCHIGTDTVSLARAGASVTGVDFSAPALESARRLAERAQVRASWVLTDVLDAAAAVRTTFDVVYTSIGTITWLADLEKWATQIATLLKPGGVFFIRDGHPILYSLDEDAPDLQLRYRYFDVGSAQAWDDESTYAGNGKVTNTRTYEWPHPLSRIVMSLISAGLHIEFFDEGDTLPWRFSERMIEVDGGYAWPASERDVVPCTYTIVARNNRQAPKAP